MCEDQSQTVSRTVCDRSPAEDTTLKDTLQFPVTDNQECLTVKK